MRGQATGSPRWALALPGSPGPHSLLGSAFVFQGFSMSSDYESFTSSTKGMERGLCVLIYFLNNRGKKNPA